VITPPVAVAAFAAASITGAEPMRTGVAAVRVGIVMFTIPFIFAWYPELLLIPEAVTITDESGAKALIEGYSGEVEIAALAMLSARLILALYLVASALARYDRGPMGAVEIAARLGLAVLIMWKTEPVMWFGICVGLAVIVVHNVLARRAQERATA
jgi:TRAP-type uncharacterized transport system fused permease subunit